MITKEELLEKFEGALVDAEASDETQLDFLLGGWRLLLAVIKNSDEFEETYSCKFWVDPEDTWGYQENNADDPIQCIVEALEIQKEEAEKARDDAQARANNIQKVLEEMNR